MPNYEPTPQVLEVERIKDRKNYLADMIKKGAGSIHHGPNFVDVYLKNVQEYVDLRDKYDELVSKKDIQEALKEKEIIEGSKYGAGAVIVLSSLSFLAFAYQARRGNKSD